jgi:hypothetical protein
VSRRDKPRRWKSGNPPPDPYEGLNVLDQLRVTLKRANTLTSREGIILGMGWGYRANDPCAYCGWPSDTWDHIEPMGRGGSAASSSNVTRSCASCNQKKGSLTLLEFLIFKNIAGDHPILVKRRQLKTFLNLLKQYKRFKIKQISSCAG